LIGQESRGGKRGKPPLVKLISLDERDRRVGIPSWLRMSWIDARGFKAGGVGGGVAVAFNIAMDSTSMDAVGERYSSPDEEGATSGTSLVCLPFFGRFPINESIERKGIAMVDLRSLVCLLSIIHNPLSCPINCLQSTDRC
jgi:hypothetical protein